MKVVIVGGVAAGASLAARLRRLDKDAEIIVIEKGDYVSYANCGLPYYVSGEIADRGALLLMNPEAFKQRFDVDVRVAHEVTKIDPDKKTVMIKNLHQGEVLEENYDCLVIATGSSPIVLPVAGADSARICQLWTFNDFEKIKERVQNEDVKSVCIVGGGFVGLETAENLAEMGISVEIVEMNRQVLNNLDYEMVQPIHQHLNQKGVHLSLGTALTGFKDEEDGIAVQTDKWTKTFDLAILSVGVKPNSALAKSAGVSCNARGAIEVDDQFRTNLPDIYAVGDVIEVTQLVNGQKTMIPLAGPANKQGRMLANILAGREAHYAGSLGTSIIKVFDMAAASTGLNEKQLNANGLVRHQDYEVVLIEQRSHAGYYPGATTMVLKLIYEKQSERILGAQVVGRDGVDKRIDVLAVATQTGMRATQLTELHLAYAPPFASAKDPINMLGYVAENQINGDVKLMMMDEYEKVKDQVVTLDVREAMERQAAKIEGSKHIPYGELMDRYEELDPNQTTVIYCAMGVRAYNCARILSLRGFKDVYVLTGGMPFYLEYTYRAH